MTDWLVDKEITCPWCWEKVTVEFDLSAGGQGYIEDCQVCCQPIEIAFDVHDGELGNVRAERSA
ncbi:MAG: CPXCG motif-containing cysteine-rich protein [Gammaproteobacteria bacterium]|jgi:transcription elongation factor Elf1